MPKFTAEIPDNKYFETKMFSKYLIEERPYAYSYIIIHSKLKFAPGPLISFTMWVQCIK